MTETQDMREWFVFKQEIVKFLENNQILVFRESYDSYMVMFDDKTSLYPTLSEAVIFAFGRFL